MIMYSLHDFRFTLNEVLTSLEKNELDASEDKHEVQATLLPPSADGLMVKDSDDSDNEVTGAFLHLRRRILTTEA